MARRNEETKILDNNRESINQLKDFNYNKEINKVIDFSEIDKYKERKAIEKAEKEARSMQRKADNEAKLKVLEEPPHSRNL